MIGTWEVRLYGYVRARSGRPTARVQRTYRFFATSFTGASAGAKARAYSEGLDAPCVWAATKLPDYEATT